MNSDKQVYIFYHSDGDGFASALLVASEYTEVHKGNGAFDVSLPYNIHLEIADYNKPIDFSKCNIRKGDEIYILDYTPQKKSEFDQIDELWDKFGVSIHFIIIDHHETALRSIEECEGIKNYLQFGGCIYPTEDFHQAGCMLVYILQKLDMLRFKNTEFCSWYFNGDDSFKDRVCEIFEREEKTAPKWLRLTADHDIYSERLEESHIFNKALYHIGLNKVYLDLREESYLKHYSIYMKYNKEIQDTNNLGIVMTQGHFMNSITDDIIKKGYEVKDITDRFHKSALYKGFEILVTLDLSKDYIDPTNSMRLDYNSLNKISAEGKLLCVQGNGNSENFLDKFEEYDACVLFTYDGERMKHNIFSKKSSKFPCNLLAAFFGKYYGISGGGHRHAAGFYSPGIVFKKNHLYTIEDGKFEMLEVSLD